MPEPADQRIMVVAPTGRDAPLIVRVLHGAGLAAEECRDISEFCAKWPEGFGAAVIAEEALTNESIGSLIECLRGQPAWSDLPLIILTGGGKTTRYSARIAQMLEPQASVTLLERPLRMLTLVSAMQSALRARRRQYEVR